MGTDAGAGTTTSAYRLAGKANGLSQLTLKAVALSVVILSLILLSFKTGAEESLGESSLIQTIDFLESATGKPQSPQSSLVARIEALELRVYGQTHDGSLSMRLAALRKTLYGDSDYKEHIQQLEMSNGGQIDRAGTFKMKEKAPGASAQKDLPMPMVLPSSAGLNASGEFSASTNLSTPSGETSSVDLASYLPLKNIHLVRFVRIEMPNTKEKVTGDYCQDVLKATHGLVFRFKEMPIPVYISDYLENGFTESCIRGFEDWEDRTNGVIRFVQVDDPNQARIKVIWSNLGVSSDPKGCTLGAHTITKWKARPPGSISTLNVAGIVPLPIYIPKLGPKFSVPPQTIEVNLDLLHSKNLEIRYQILENVVAHELGHALGILGHSPWKSDLMYPVTDEHSRLSQRDVNTVLKIYQQKADVSL